MDSKGLSAPCLEFPNAGVPNLDMATFAAEFLESDMALEGAFLHGDDILAVMALERGGDFVEVGVNHGLAVEDDRCFCAFEGHFVAVPGVYQ